MMKLRVLITTDFFLWSLANLSVYRIDNISLGYLFLQQISHFLLFCSLELLLVVLALENYELPFISYRELIITRLNENRSC